MGINLSYNNIELKRLNKIVDKIIQLEDEMKSKSDYELKEIGLNLKNHVKSGKNLDDLLIEAFALCRETTFRVLGKRQYKVQLIGGICMHQGRVIEMKTGEGKTITELCPAYLNALTGKGVHIVTVNEYLAERDKTEMENVFKFLGVSVGLVLEKTENKKEEYSKDIVYTTNYQLGFDYLRDNLVNNIEYKVQRELNFIILDEIDSIFIDDAKTPLIISTKEDCDSSIYIKIDSIIKKFDKNDYYIDKKFKAIFPSELGVSKIEKELKLNNLSDINNLYINHIVFQSLTANFLMNKDVDYIISGDDLLIIDSNTGRIAEGRVFSDDLQQCLEAKEGITIKPKTKTLASITYQHFFKLYNKVSGMSGTVKSEENEFRKIYNLDVISIPTNKPIRRVDKNDRFFLDEKYKLKALIEDIKVTHKKGQPILIGTSTIRDSEKISKLLNKYKIYHKLLNAKTKKEEALIIEKAGEVNSITIATNIAGRGTDIKLGKEALNLGGLKVLGVGRSESIRIDNQLIGRSGRQGDIGESQFYLSCNDRLLSIYSKDNIREYLNKYVKDNGEIEYRIVKKFIKRAQQSINNISFEQRKNTFEYDEIIDIQRKIIYQERDILLKGEGLEYKISNIILNEIKDICLDIFLDKDKVEEKNIFKVKLNKYSSEEIEKYFLMVKSEINSIFNYNLNDIDLKELMNEKMLYKVINKISDILIDSFNNKYILDENLDLNLIKKLFLEAVDLSWQEHLINMDYLRMYARDQCYAYKNPIDIYRLESINVSKNLFKSIRVKFIKSIYK